MGAIELLREGNVAATLAQLQKDVRAEPANPGHRTFLFQLSAVTGDWGRAAAQLEVAGKLDPKSLPMVQTYRAALECEALRRVVFAGEKMPLLFGDPQEWVALMFDALRLSGIGRHKEAQQIRDGALERAPASAGKIGDVGFEWLADCDSRLGPMCEAIVNGKYYWIPFQRVQKIEFDAPTDLRDAVWMPASITFANGGQTVALIPTRYPGSESSGDDRIRLARKTDWNQPADNVFSGIGQRMFATDQGEYPMMDVRVIEIFQASAGIGTQG